MPSIRTHDLSIHTPQGQLYAKRWHYGAPSSQDLAPLVLLHDSLGCVALWRDFPERLAHSARRDVIAYDRLGFGLSDPHPGALDLDFIQREASQGFQAVLDQCQLRRAIPFGHSVGGGMAISCAATHADRCTGLITESAQAFVEDRTLAGIRYAQAQFAEPAQRDRLRKYHGDKAEWVLNAWIDTWLASNFTDWNLDAVLPKVTCPLLAIHGEQDEYGSILHPQRLAVRASGEVTLAILSPCGHVPHRERADDVLARVTAWIDQHERSDLQAGTPKTRP